MAHYYSQTQDSKFIIKKITEHILGEKIEFYTSPGVFSKEGIDNGTRLLIEKAIIKDNWKILDLGCGYGPIGISIAKAYPKSDVMMSDINERAIVLSQKNIQLAGAKNAIAIQSDIFQKIGEGKEFDTILINPPQHAGMEICKRMIKQSSNHLKKNGLLQIVARKNSGGKTLEAEMIYTFGNSIHLAKKGEFTVYLSKKN